MAQAQDRACYSAFGVRVELDAGRHPFLRDDSLWRVRQIYERFLGLHPPAETGVAIDIGAGFGAFAIPFALAHPGWRVICFEPAPQAFELLSANIRTLGLTTVTAVRCAVGRTAAISDDLRTALRTGDAARIAATAPQSRFYQNRNSPGFVSDGSRSEWRNWARTLRVPTIPADGLAELEPTLVKFVCPGVEDDVLGAIGGRAAHVIGESWEIPAARHVYRERQAEHRAYVPVAGTLLRLRREPDDRGRREGLDVVVALYNARDWVVDCVSGIVGNDDPDVRAIVVDDGSTDGSGDLVRQHFRDNDRGRVSCTSRTAAARRRAISGG